MPLTSWTCSTVRYTPAESSLSIYAMMHPFLRSEHSKVNLVMRPKVDLVVNHEQQMKKRSDNVTDVECHTAWIAMMSRQSCFAQAMLKLEVYLIIAGNAFTRGITDPMEEAPHANGIIPCTICYVHYKYDHNI